MNWQIIRTIAEKDIRLVLKNKMGIAAALVMPLLFAVIIPTVIILLAHIPQIAAARDIADQLNLLGRLPDALRAMLVSLDGRQFFVTVILGFMLAPMFLILPLTAASTIGAESFAGEKERKTLEALLYTPATDAELFIAKVLAGVGAAMTLALGSFVLYTLVANLIGWPIMGRIWFPLPTWWSLILWVSPAVATFGISASVLVSSRVSTFLDAHQTGSLMVLPILSVVIGQLAGVIYMTTEVVMIAGFILWILAGFMLRFGVKQFARSRLMSRI